MTTEYGAGIRQRQAMLSRQLSSPLPERMQAMIASANDQIKEPVSGITADGNVIPGLFPIAKTGVSTAKIKDAAEGFLAVLTKQQRDAATFKLKSDAWRRWSNIHPFLMRHGALMEEMSGLQREAGLDIMRATLSNSGFKLAQDIMHLNETIGEITESWLEYGEWVYWISIFGTPSLTEPWGYQVDGHHLNLNCFILGDQVVLSPLFMGSEPVHAHTGKYAGTRIMEAEESRGLEFMLGLSSEQQVRTGLGTPGHPMDGRIQGGAFRDNLVLPYEGISGMDLTGKQRDDLLSLVEVYVGRVQQGQAAVKLDEVRRHLDQTYFAWAGEATDKSVYYYRVHSPVILIEFDHQRGVAFDNETPSRQHIHSIVRTPNGNDYGLDLLAQHYALHHK